MANKLLNIFPTSGAATYDKFNILNTPRNTVFIEGKAFTTVICTVYNGALIITNSGNKDKIELTLSGFEIGSFDVILPNSAYVEGGLITVKVEDKYSSNNSAINYIRFLPYNIGEGRFKLYNCTFNAVANGDVPSTVYMKIDRHMDIGTINSVGIRLSGDAFTTSNGMSPYGEKMKTLELPLDSDDCVLFQVYSDSPGLSRIYISLPSSPDGDMMTIDTQFKSVS